MEVGNRITAVNGRPIFEAHDLLTVLAGKKPGQAISLALDRSGTRLTVEVRLGELPD
jgi:S1-C subfamily serine protease